MSCFHPQNAVVLGIDPQTGKKALKFFGDDVDGGHAAPADEGFDFVGIVEGRCHVSVPPA